MLLSKATKEEELGLFDSSSQLISQEQSTYAREYRARALFALLNASGVVLPSTVIMDSLDLASFAFDVTPNRRRGETGTTAFIWGPYEILRHVLEGQVERSVRSSWLSTGFNFSSWGETASAGARTVPLDVLAERGLQSGLEETLLDEPLEAKPLGVERVKLRLSYGGSGKPILQNATELSGFDDRL